MKLSIRIIASCLAITGISGCAIVATGMYQNVHIVSSEPGSEVYINDDLADSTPCDIKIKRSHKTPPKVVVRKKGFQEEEVELRKRLNQHVWLNLFNIPGWVIDFATGASVRYSQPDTVVLNPKRKTKR